MTTDELIEIYDKASREGFVRNGTWLDTHSIGLEAVAEAVLADYRGNKVEKLNPQMIGRLVTIKWSHGTTQAVTGKLAAYTEVEDYGFRLWFEGTHPEGYLVADDLNITVHGGAA